MMLRPFLRSGSLLGMLCACGAGETGPGVQTGTASAVLEGLISDKFHESAHAERTRREEEIRAEVARLGQHPWAGSYFEGDGLGENVSLELAPKGGATFAWDGCLGLYDHNWGFVVERDGVLRFRLALPNVREAFQGFPEELVVVPWGDRVYLIEPADLTSFANSINDHSEPRSSAWGQFLMREGDEARSVQGSPSYPPGVLTPELTQQAK